MTSKRSLDQTIVWAESTSWLCHDVRAKPASYSYGTNSPSCYKYIHRSCKYFFQITPINDYVAAIQFFSNNKYTVQIPLPAKFKVRDTTKRLINPYHNSFFITWIKNYKIFYDHVVIFELTNQREQVIETVNGGVIVT
jgi:hypothetical protein